nr:MAG TPA_asm: hypothetical protein [Caudoviricetes sp.]
MVRPAGRGLLTPKSLAETVELGGCCCRVGTFRWLRNYCVARIRWNVYSPQRG